MFSQEDLSAIQSRVESAVSVEIAECMTAAGFDYTAFVVDEPSTPNARFDSAETIAENGYGIATAWIDRARARSADPNADVIIALSPTEFEEYMLALNGDQFGGVAGCVSTAEAEVLADPELSTIAVVDDALSEGVSRIDSRAEVTETFELWTACMNDAGYEISGPGDPEARINNELDFLSQRLNATLPPGAGIEEIRAVTQSALPADIQEDLDRLIEEERAVAAQDLECYQTHIEPVRAPLIEDLETAILEENRDGLEAAGLLD